MKYTWTMYKALLILILITAIIGFIKIPQKQDPVPYRADTSEYVLFTDNQNGVSFVYPKDWGAITQKEGSTICPEEDTYRTPDTLHIFDREYVFSGVALRDTESFIKAGIRVYDMPPQEQCQDEFLRAIISGIIKPETISSVRLEPIYGKDQLIGMYNDQASRLNTEYRIQYSFFEKNEEGNNRIIQSYLSFVPVAGSKELKEIEEMYSKNIVEYVTKSPNAQMLREYIKIFKEISESIPK